jgi:hypothetical protein
LQAETSHATSNSKQTSLNVRLRAIIFRNRPGPFCLDRPA